MITALWVFCGIAVALNIVGTRLGYEHLRDLQALRQHRLARSRAVTFVVMVSISTAMTVGLILLTAFLNIWIG